MGPDDFNKCANTKTNNVFVIAIGISWDKLWETFKEAKWGERLAGR